MPKNALTFILFVVIGFVCGFTLFVASPQLKKAEAQDKAKKTKEKCSPKG